LNFRLCLFFYGPIDGDNKPIPISEDHVKKGKLRMTGREMLCFVKNFGVLVGDLIPRNYSYWKLYLKLRNILDFAMAPHLCPDDLLLIEAIVTGYFKYFLELEPKYCFKPKDHLLTHYWRIMEQVGPLSKIFCWRFQAKHKKLKATATTPKKNLALTIAIKHQLSLCHRFIANQNLVPVTKFGPTHLVDLELEESYHLFKNCLPSTINVNNCAFSQWVEYKGTRYTSDMTLVIGVEDFSPLFAKIELIVPDYVDDVLFICSHFSNLGFDEHMHS